MKTLKLDLFTPFGGKGALLLAALSLGGCNIKDPIATPVLTADCGTPPVSIIDGDTIKTVIFKDYKKLNALDPNGKNYIVVGDTVVTYREPKLHTPPAKAPDLSKLKNNDDPDLKGKPLRYVAIGGSLTAGVRDGGYFNEGILTSYPNLIARQMKLEKFEQPLFDAADYNGFGRKVRTTFNPTGGPVPKFNEVKNNSGVESVDEKGVRLKKYLKGQTLDIMAIPNVPSYVLLGGYQEYPYPYNGKKSPIAPFYERIEKYMQINAIGGRFIGTEKADLYTFDRGINQYIDYLLGKDENLLTDGNNVSGYVEKFIAYSAVGQGSKSRKSKLCIATIPDVFDLPFFNIISREMVLKNYGGDGIAPSYEKTLCFIPNGTIDSLLSPKVHISFKDNIIRQKQGQLRVWKTNEINNTKIYMIQQTNEATKAIAKEFGFPVADLYGLYKKIHNEGFITDDGIKVSPAFPNGNFYSSDGLYPSPFGNAVIANEFIKAINAYYRTEIPLIKTAEYLELK